MKISNKSYLEELLDFYPPTNQADIRRLEEAGRKLRKDPEFGREFQEAMAEERRLQAVHSD